MAGIMANADDTLRRAEETFNRGDHGGAERVLAELWKDTTNAPPRALHLLGSIRYEQHDLPRSEAYHRRAIEGAPREGRFHAALGQTLFAAGRYDAAADALGEALRLDPSLADVQLPYAHACFASKRFKDAEAAARAVVARAPSTHAWDTLSSSLREQGRAQEALDAAEQGLELDPSSRQCQHSRAAALISLGRNDEALAIFDQLRNQGIEVASTLFFRAKALVNLKRYSEALSMVETGLVRWPGDDRLQAAAAELRKRG
jgi:tetratricopeptide (TPR) repeat protein